MSPEGTVYAFDGFEVNVGLGTFTFQGHPVPITPKALQTLILLLRNPAEVVEKERFLNEIWGNAFVEESTLAQNIRTLRKTLAARNPDKEFIVTVPRRGYLFTESVAEISSLANRAKPDKATKPVP